MRGQLRQISCAPAARGRGITLGKPRSRSRTVAEPGRQRTVNGRRQPTKAERCLKWTCIGSLCLALSLGGCNKCTGEEDIVETQEVEGSSELPWEKISFGVDENEFKKAVTASAGLSDESAFARIACNPQITIDVIDPKAGSMSERGSGDHSLSNCTFLQVGSAGQSGKPASVRGEFVDGRLVSITFRFPSAGHDGLAREIEKRFAQGTARKIKQISAIGESSADMLLWKVDDELWVLGGSQRETTLVRQSPAALSGFPKPPKASVRGVPVPLDVIGLGGGLDLNDDLDDIPIVDGGD